MNRYESILLDKMVDIERTRLALGENNVLPAQDKQANDEFVSDVLLLLDCICDFREPPRALDVADGYGALATVDERGEVIA